MFETCWFEARDAGDPNGMDSSNPDQFRTDARKPDEEQRETQERLEHQSDDPDAPGCTKPMIKSPTKAPAKSGIVLAEAVMVLRNIIVAAAALEQGLAAYLVVIGHAAIHQGGHHH